MTLRLIAFALALGLAACGGNTPPPVTYKPLDYSYLPPITLKVANINIQNNYVPDPGAATLIGQDPEAPANALTDMLNRRLVANGMPGTATVTIEDASIDQQGGNLTGAMTVRVDVASADNRRTGYVEASVSHAETAPDPDASQATMQAALYGVTRQLMDAMNVKLQYQIQQNLPAWVAFAPNAAAPALNAGAVSTGGIIATPLSNAAGAPQPLTPAASLPAVSLPPGAPPEYSPPPVDTGNQLPPVDTGNQLPPVNTGNPLPPGSLPLGTMPVPPPSGGTSQ